MSIKPRSCKNKGARLQKWVAVEIGKIVNVKVGKDLDIESRPMSQSGTDVILHGEAKEKFKFSVECKNTEKTSIYAWIKQAVSNVIKGTNWIIVHKKNYNDPIVILEAKVFFKIYKELIRLREKGGE